MLSHPLQKCHQEPAFQIEAHLGEDKKKNGDLDLLICCRMSCYCGVVMSKACPSSFTACFNLTSHCSGRKQGTGGTLASHAFYLWQAMGFF